MLDKCIKCTHVDCKNCDVFTIMAYDREKGWHYPSRGEYPTEKNKQYLCKVKDCRKVWYEVVDWDDFWLLDEFNQVVAWQYIEPPKEEV